MRAREPQRLRSTHGRFIFTFTFAVGAGVLFGAAPSARADTDPLAGAALPEVPQSNVAERSQQAPASAPAGSEANFPTGLVERLPSSAYPEPVIRGLYGSSLWLDMQGYQWPYYPRIGVGVSGYAWVDTDFKRTRIGDPGQSDHWTQLFEQGRFALRLTPTYTNGSWFVQAQAELIGNLNQLEVQTAVADTDDMWVRTGVWKNWDVTVGRFEAFSVYHLGMGLDLNTDERIGAYDQTMGTSTVQQPYMASYLLYRAAGPANIAFHIYRNALRLELLAQYGNEGATNDIGGRPAIIYDLGWIKFRAAAEYQLKFARDPSPALHNESRNRGVAGSVQFVFAPRIEFGPNIGRAVTDLYDASTLQMDGSFLPRADKSGDIWSYGGFMNARPFNNDFLIGLGANYASFTNLHTNTAGQGDKSTNTQYFVALQYLVHHQLFVKVVGGYAKSHFDRSFSNMVSYDDDMFSMRVRLMYLY